MPSEPQSVPQTPAGKGLAMVLVAFLVGLGAQRALEAVGTAQQHTKGRAAWTAQATCPGGTPDLEPTVCAAVRAYEDHVGAPFFCAAEDGACRAAWAASPAPRP